MEPALHLPYQLGLVVSCLSPLGKAPIVPPFSGGTSDYWWMLEVIFFNVNPLVTPLASTAYPLLQGWPWLNLLAHKIKQKGIKVGKRLVGRRKGWQWWQWDSMKRVNGIHALCEQNCQRTNLINKKTKQKGIYWSTPLTSLTLSSNCSFFFF